jgi:hypothetical protein
MTDFFKNNNIIVFPEITTIDFTKINQKHLKVILVHTVFVFFLVYSALFFINYNNFFEFGSATIWLYSLITFVFISVLFIKRLGFNKRKYAVREKDISYQRGVLFRSLTTVPFNRIQHIEIDEEPISRFFGLVSLSVFTAGDSSDDLKIAGLLKEEAAQIKEFISTKIDG